MTVKTAETKLNWLRKALVVIYAIGFMGGLIAMAVDGMSDSFLLFLTILLGFLTISNLIEIRSRHLHRKTE